MDTHGMTENQRAYDEVLADAIRVLTEAARLNRPAPGEHAAAVERQAVATEPVDWAEFVTLAVAGAAANVGSIEKALRGRPGSWEADKVRSMLLSTVGEEPAELLRHQTEPLVVEIWPEEILDDLGYPQLYNESRHLLEEQRGPHRWRYRLTEDRAEGERGTWEAVDKDAPPFEEPAGNERGVAWGWPQRAGTVMEVPRSAEDEAELERLDELEDALEVLYEQDPIAYGEALRVTVLAKATELFPGVDVTVEIRTDVQRFTPDTDRFSGPAEQLIEVACAETPLPWSGIAPKDYPTGASAIADAEREAGRLPHLRLNP